MLHESQAEREVTIIRLCATKKCVQLLKKRAIFQVRALPNRLRDTARTSRHPLVPKKEKIALDHRTVTCFVACDRIHGDP